MSAHAPSRTTFTERLWPGPWVWLLALGGVLALGIAYGASLGPMAGWAVGLAGAGLALGSLLRWAIRVSVEPEGLRAGRALLPWEWVGRVVVLDGPAARAARGPAGDASAHLVLRPGVGPGAVVLEVTDPEDPHRTWLVASRDPAAMARAIEQARGRLAP